MPKKETVQTEPAEVERIADVGLNFDPDPTMARGDCRDAILNVLRTTADWGKFNEQQQRDINSQIDQTAETIIAKLVKAIASEGRDAVRCKVESLTVKDGIKLVLTANFDHDTLVMLGDMQGGYVQLVTADVSEHDGQRSAAHVDPDQPELLTGDDSDLVNAGDVEEGEALDSEDEQQSEDDTVAAAA